jgi:hypothetical protein
MISDERRDAIFEQMNSYVIGLDTTQTSPRYFIDRIAVCRNYLNSVSLVLSELQRERLIADSELSKLQAIMELESASLLATDEHVKRLSNIKDRESTVLYKLRDKRQRIDFLKGQLRTVDGVMKHVSLRNRELHATMEAIKNQRRFMHIEVQTGAFYGDERVPEHERTIGMGTGGVTGDFGEGEIRALIESSDSEDAVAEMDAALEEAAAVAKGAPIPQLPPAPPQEPVVVAPVAQEAPPAPPVDMTPTEDAEAIRLFLGDPTTTVEPSSSAPQGESDDFSFLLDSV